MAAHVAWAFATQDQGRDVLGQEPGHTGSHPENLPMIAQSMKVEKGGKPNLFNPVLCFGFWAFEGVCESLRARESGAVGDSTQHILHAGIRPSRVFG